MSVPPPEPASSELFPPCPNCGQPWPPEVPVCPNCGYLRPAGSSWLPTPGGQPATRPRLPSKLVTGSATGDVLLGLGISALTFVSLGIGFLVIPILYFLMRRQYPVFARGLGFGWIAGTALLLGALAVCIGLLSQSGQHGGL